MFELKKKLPMNKAELQKIILNFDDNTANIEYKVGYKEGSKFISIGTDTLFLQDVGEERDDEDNVIKEATTDYSDFYAKLNHEADPYDVAIEMLEKKGIKKEVI